MNFIESITPVCWSLEVLFSVNSPIGVDTRILLVSSVVKEINAKSSMHLKGDQWWVKAKEHLSFSCVLVNG